MSVGVEIQGQEAIPGAVEAAINRAIAGLDGAAVEIIPGGQRGPARNALIARVLQSWKRNPFYLDQQGREAIAFALRGLTAGQFSTRMRALVLAGEAMKNAIQRNLERQENPDGSTFRALTEKYAAYKQRKFGFKVPIGRATGDLMDNLQVRVTTK